MNTAYFLEDLQNRIDRILQQAESQIVSQSNERLNKKSSDDKWSNAEILEHLNRYADYYLPRFEKAIQTTKLPFKEEAVRRTWFGKKSIAMMHPDNAKPQKAKKKLNPSFSEVRADVVSVFIDHQKHFLELLKQAKNVSINKAKIPAEVFPLLKLRLGECMDFVLTHQERHFKQLH